MLGFVVRPVYLGTLRREQLFSGRRPFFRSHSSQEVREAQLIPPAQEYYLIRRGYESGTCIKWIMKYQ